MRKRMSHFRFVHASADWAVLLVTSAISFAFKGMHKLQAARRAFNAIPMPNCPRTLVPQASFCKSKPMFYASKTTLASLVCLGLATTSAGAQDTMTAQEFDTYTRGKTLFYGQGGQSYGAEVYMDNRRVRWSFLDGECKDGEWYEDAGQICFIYEGSPEPQCWTFSERSAGLVARFENAPGATDLYEAANPGEEMVCLGPEVGV